MAERVSMKNYVKNLSEVGLQSKCVKGFTLVEVMIVVAIIGILAAIAVPAYSDYVIRARVPEATAMLASKRVQMEQYFQDNRRYETSATACTANTSTSSFTYACDVPTATTYTITATGTGTMSGFSYTINQANERTSTIGGSAKASWQTALKNCWVTKQGGGC
jgi:type IV pilus assembly protein PilE